MKTIVRCACYRGSRLLLGVIGLSAALPVVCAADSVPPGAYLRRPADTKAALLRQLERDPKVSERYARTFRMSPKMVRLLFQQLHLTHLKEDRILQIHYVRAGEQLGYRRRRVRRGTPVFALPDGRPALIQVCGNPARSDRSSMALWPSPGRSLARRPPAPSTGMVLDFDPQEPEFTPVSEPNLVVTMRTARPSTPPTGDTGTTEASASAQTDPETGFALEASRSALAFSPAAGLPLLEGLSPRTLPAVRGHRAEPFGDDFVPLQGIPAPGRTPPTPLGKTPSELEEEAENNLEEWLDNEGGLLPGGGDGGGSSAGSGSLPVTPTDVPRDPDSEEDMPGLSESNTPGQDPAGPAAIVPEPGSAAWFLLVLGLSGAVLRRRRRGYIRRAFASCCALSSQR